MPGTIIIRQGEDLEFCFSRDGDSLEGWVCTIFVKQYPNDAPAITRVIPVSTQDPLTWQGFLTSTETAALAVGSWLLIGKLTNSGTDEEDQVLIRFAVSEAWA